MSTPNDLLTLLKNEALMDFGTPLVALIQNVQAAKLDPLKVTAAWIQFRASVLSELGTFEQSAANDVLNFILDKIQSAIMGATQPVVAPVAMAAVHQKN